MIAVTPGFWRDRLRASAIHLGISASIAALAALVVFLLWYPWPYRELSGGRELFEILVSVDVVLGPLITLAIFNRAKGWRVLRRDLAMVGLLQLVALGYGVWTTYVARPVHLVFEYDRFRVVHAIEIPESELAKAPFWAQSMPRSGPTMLALRPFTDGDEQYQSTMLALQGLPLSAQPALWTSYEGERAKVLAASKPVTQLRVRFPNQLPAIDKAIREAGRAEDKLVYLSVVGRKTFWTALVDASSAEVVAFLPLDSF